MAELRILLLGVPRLEVDGVPCHLTLRKSVALLAYLALNPGEHSREYLGTLLWPEVPAARALHYVRNALWQLNRTPLAHFIAADRQVIGLRVDSAETRPMNPGVGDHSLTIDARHLCNALEANDAHGHLGTETCVACVDPLERAVAAWRGDFLQGFSLRDSLAFDEWQAQQAQLLRSAVTQALAILAHWYGEARDIDEAIAYARRWTELEPLHEPAHQALIRLYLQAGRRADAARQYEAFETQLDTELGVPPAPETRALLECISGRADASTLPEPDGEGGDLVPDSVPRRAARNLPHPRTELIGRRELVTNVADRLRDPAIRLLTLTGVGGTGKTRLAVAVASALLQDFRDGVTFVDLAPVHDPAHVPSALVDALGLQISPGPSARSDGDSLSETALRRVIWHLEHRAMLLIFDNFEHLLPATPLVGRLLAAAPGLKALTTSRAPLGIYGECLQSIPALSLPHATDLRAIREAASVRLFVARSAAVRPGFRLTSGNAGTVAAICRRLDGLPLALELAAARSRLMSPEGILSGVKNALAFLTHGPSDVAPRHQTLRATTAWSYALLTPSTQMIFRSLATFAGGFSPPAAAAVCGLDGVPEVMAHLEVLLDQSLIATDPGVDSAVPRFTMLETVRAYADEMLSEMGERHRARALHARWALALAEEAAPAFLGGDAERARWTARLRLDRDNLRAALTWAIERGNEAPGESVPVDQALSGAACLEEDGSAAVLPAESFSWAALALRLAAALPRYWQIQGSQLEGLTWLRRALALDAADDPDLMRLRAQAFQWAGLLASEADRDAMGPLLESSMELWERLGDRTRWAAALADYGQWRLIYDDLATARRYLEEAIAVLRAEGAERALVRALRHLSTVAQLSGGGDEGIALAGEAVRLGVKHGMGVELAEARWVQANAIYLSGDYAAAEPVYEGLLAQARAVGDTRLEVAALCYLGTISRGMGRDDKARSLWLKCTERGRDLHHKVQVGWATVYLGELDVLDGDLAHAEVRFHEALGYGKRGGSEFLVLRAAGDLGRLALRQGDTECARVHYTDCLERGLATDTWWSTVVGILGCAAIALHEGALTRAAHLAGAARAIVDGPTVELPDVIRQSLRDLLDPVLADLVEAWPAPARESALEKGGALLDQGRAALTAYAVAGA